MSKVGSSDITNFESLELLKKKKAFVNKTFQMESQNVKS